MPHQIVVGGVLVTGKPYYQVTPESLAKDKGLGFTHETAPAHAHTWVALRDGTLTDATIVPVLAKKLGKRIKWNEVIIVGPGVSLWAGIKIEHQPMLKGLNYYRSAVIPQTATTPIEAMTIEFGNDWARRLDEVNIAARRIGRCEYLLSRPRGLQGRRF